MGTPEIASIYLQSLIDSKSNIVAVFSQPPRKKGRGMQLQKTPVHKFAILNGINTYTPLNLNCEKVKKNINDLNPDLIIVMGYGLKLNKYILQLPSFGCINIHVSLLPRWRGASPIEHAIMNGDKKTGITIFKLIEEMDAGPIISTDSILIDSNENKEDLTKRLNILGLKLLNSILPNIFNKKINYQIQNQNNITYANKISTENRKLDFNENIETISNKIRAFSPKPSAWLIYKNERIKIIRSKVVKGIWEPATILNENFDIGCRDGKICSEIIQREGKKPMYLNDFLRGFNFNVGDKINV